MITYAQRQVPAPHQLLATGAFVEFRELQFSKLSDFTSLHIRYSDSFSLNSSVGNGGAICTVYLDGFETPITTFVYSPGTGVNFAAGLAAGYMEGIPAGPHLLQVKVTSVNNADVRPSEGPFGSSPFFVLEVDEIDGALSTWPPLAQ